MTTADQREPIGAPRGTPIAPIYRCKPGSTDIALGEAPIEIVTQQSTVQGVGRAKLRLQPDLKLIIESEFVEDPVAAHFAMAESMRADFKYGTHFLPGKANVVWLSLQSEALLAKLMPNPQAMSSGAPEQQLQRLVVHIVNFPQFWSVRDGRQDLVIDAPNGGWKLLGRAVLNDPPWTIELQATPETEETVQQLKETAGYGITHLAELTRQDGQPFTVEDGSKVIHDLYRLLSFARGAWTPPILAVGFDQRGARVHENWAVRIGTPWEGRLGWFDAHHGQSLSALWPGFRALLHDQNLGKAVSQALYWYLRSNRGGDGLGVDSGVILGQAALERLSSAHIEATGVKMSKGARATDYLREALLRLGIPTAVPALLKGLAVGQQANCWTDGPEAIVRIRNELVHPRNKLPIKIGTVVAEAWNLSQWYAELIVLRLSGYDGKYSNRLRRNWVGQVESVPWKT